MLYIVRMGGAFAVALEVAGGLLSQATGFHPLPLGGNHLTQLGIVFGVTYIACELCALKHEAKPPIALAEAKPLVRASRFRRASAAMKEAARIAFRG